MAGKKRSVSYVKIQSTKTLMYQRTYFHQYLTQAKKGDLVLGTGINEHATLGDNRTYALFLHFPLKFPFGPGLCNSVTEKKVLSGCISLHFRELEAWFTRADKALRSPGRRANPFLAIGIYWLLSGCLKKKMQSAQ